MQRLTPPGLDFAVSRFAFGTARLHHVGTADAERLISTAAAHGFSHFDTAPYYGLGLSERLLGRVLAGIEDVTVATKVGLYPPTGTARGRIGMLARKALGKTIPPLGRPFADWTVQRARASLDGSLRRMRRDRVDLLWLHEPDRALIATDEWRRWLESERDRVRAFGLAGEPANLAPFLEPAKEPWTLQTRDSVGGWEADVLAAHSDRLAFTYGYLSASRRADAGTVLRAALDRRPECAIIISTRRPKRLALLERLVS